MNPSHNRATQSRRVNGVCDASRCDHQIIAPKKGSENSMRNVSSATASIGAAAYASFAKIDLAEKPNAPSNASAGPTHSRSVLGPGDVEDNCFGVAVTRNSATSSVYRCFCGREDSAGVAPPF